MNLKSRPMDVTFDTNLSLVKIHFWWLYNATMSWDIAQRFNQPYLFKSYLCMTFKIYFFVNLLIYKSDLLELRKILQIWRISSEGCSYSVELLFLSYWFCVRRVWMFQGAFKNVLIKFCDRLQKATSRTAIFRGYLFYKM